MIQMNFLKILEKKDFEANLNRLFSSNREVQIEAVRYLYEKIYKDDNLEMIFLLEEKERTDVLKRLNGLHVLFKAHSLYEEEKMWNFEMEFENEKEMVDAYERTLKFMSNELSFIDFIRDYIRQAVGVRNEELYLSHSERYFIERVKESGEVARNYIGETHKACTDEILNKPFPCVSM